MHTIYVGNAPCSWGTLEFAGLAGNRIAYPQMLDELRDSGYTGSELGDWGFLPTDPAVLRAELTGRGLTLTGAFVPVDLKDPAAHGAGEAAALRVANLLAATASAEQPPFLVLADSNGTNSGRVLYAGRVTPRMGLRANEWPIYARGVERIARAVRDATGLRTVFHHHCAGFVETPDEIARLLELTDPALVGLAFDTGHYLYGTGSSDPAAVAAGLERFAERIWYMHLKDCATDVANNARNEGLDYFEALRDGLFCELGAGGVDFANVLAWLHAHNYQGYVTVEQDLLPGTGNPALSAKRNREYLRGLGL